MSFSYQLLFYKFFYDLALIPIDNMLIFEKKMFPQHIEWKVRQLDPTSNNWICHTLNFCMR
jgi:hypothetical protein